MFSFFSPQALHFGRGQAAQTTTLAAGFGTHVLIVHGSNAARAAWLIEDCRAAGLSVTTQSCGSEPSLPALEAALARVSADRPDVVVALGGGSVIDFAKALAALIPCAGAPLDYLEGVGGGKPLDRAPLPMIALPTTAGTGAEVTKNAVIAVPEHGVKVSLRDARMIPDIAIVDAGLMQGAPRRVTLAAGLDAVTQVIEPYLSVKATPMTDALCQAAIPKGLAALRAVVEHDAAEAWDDMAWVSTCGMTSSGMAPLCTRPEMKSNSVAPADRKPISISLTPTLTSRSKKRRFFSAFIGSISDWLPSRMSVDSQRGGAVMTRLGH